MPGNSSDSRKDGIAVLRLSLFLCAFFNALSLVGAEDAAADRHALSPVASWYESDAAGIAYRSISAVYAPRAEWSLRVRTLPDKIEGVFAARVEEKTLFERGVERRRIVTAYDEADFTVFSETKEADGRSRTERYDVRRRLSEERTLDADGSGAFVKYEWDGDRLARASSFAVSSDGTTATQPTWTDTYRYFRNGALRSVDRSPDSVRFVQNTERAVPRSLETRSADGSSMRTLYDESGRATEVTRVDSDGKTIPVVETIVYGDGEKRNGPSVTRRTDGDATIETERDGRGRVLRETRISADSSIVEETRTEWDGDRVKTVTNVAGKKTKRVEYGYDSKGNRMSEKDYLNGVLERVVRKDGDSEIEELYRKGLLVLRAYYEGGRMVREERLR